MSKITYDSNYIRPIEAISIAHTPIFGDNGIRLSNLYTVNLRGKLLVNRGSPTSSGTFAYLGSNDCENIPETGVSSTTWIDSLLTKRCALSNLLKNDYKELSIGMLVGTTNLTCFPRVVSFTVDESDNPQYWPFNIQFEADNLYCSGTPIDPTGSPRIKSFGETWEFNYSDDEVSGLDGDNRVYNVTHTVNAQGLPTYGSGIVVYSGVDAAREYVKGKIGVLATQPITAISGFDNYSTKYNYVDSHSIDVGAGSYSVTETWIYCTGSVLEQYSIEQSTSSSRACPTVSINGNIRGLCIRNLGTGEISTSKYTNATNYWNSLVASTGLKTRAETFSGYTLYDNPFSTSVSIAPVEGTISYNYEFRGGPTKKLSSALWENFAVQNQFSEDIYANPTILGRGEIIQIINGGGFGKLNKTTLSVDALFPCSTGIHILGPRFTAPYSGELQTAINLYNPYLSISGVGYIAVESQSENWSAYDSSYTYSVTWAWALSGVCS